MSRRIFADAFFLSIDGDIIKLIKVVTLKVLVCWYVQFLAFWSWITFHSQDKFFLVVMCCSFYIWLDWFADVLWRHLFLHSWRILVSSSSLCVYWWFRLLVSTFFSCVCCLGYWLVLFPHVLCWFRILVSTFSSCVCWFRSEEGCLSPPCYASWQTPCAVEILSTPSVAIWFWSFHEKAFN